MKGRFRMQGWIGVLGALVLILNFGCEKDTGPDRSGVITLSSQLFGAESYYLFGYNFEESGMFKYPVKDEAIPDIINEGFPVIGGESESSLPGFNTPGRLNGFALVGEFPNAEDAKSFFNDYTRVEEGLQYHILSDTVKLHQVWVQKTSAGNYAKILVRDIVQVEVTSGSAYNEVTLEFNYSNDGSAEF